MPSQSEKYVKFLWASMGGASMFMGWEMHHPNYYMRLASDGELKLLMAEIKKGLRRLAATLRKMKANKEFWKACFVRREKNGTYVFRVRGKIGR